MSGHSVFSSEEFLSGRSLPSLTNHRAVPMVEQYCSKPPTKNLGLVAALANCLQDDRQASKATTRYVFS